MDAGLQRQPLEIIRNLRRFAVNEEDRKTFLSNVHSAMAPARYTVHKDGNKAEKKAKTSDGAAMQSLSRLLRTVPSSTFLPADTATYGPDRRSSERLRARVGLGHSACDLFTSPPFFSANYGQVTLPKNEKSARHSLTHLAEGHSLINTLQRVTVR